MVNESAATKGILAIELQNVNLLYKKFEQLKKDQKKFMRLT